MQGHYSPRNKFSRIACHGAWRTLPAQPSGRHHPQGGCLRRTQAAGEISHKTDLLLNFAYAQIFTACA